MILSRQGRALITTEICGNSLYTIVPGPTWEQAEANSILLSGHLITIEDENKNEFMHINLAQTATEGLYIRYNKEDAASTWGLDFGYRFKLHKMESRDP